MQADKVKSFDRQPANNSGEFMNIITSHFSVCHLENMADKDINWRRLQNYFLAHNRLEVMPRFRQSAAQRLMFPKKETPHLVQLKSNWNKVLRYLS